jgi:hypothetical protein
MAWRVWLVALAIAAPAGAAGPPADLPPLVLPTATELTDLPSGVPVSQPLRATLLPDGDCGPPPAAMPPPRPTTVLMELAEADHPLGHSWHTLELLVWWPRAAPLPPLVAAGPPLPGVDPHTLLGGRAIDTPAGGGGRFTVGFAVNPEETAGLAFTYLFLGTATARASAGDLLGLAPRAITRPVVRADTGEPGAVAVAVPGRSSGVVAVSTTDRIAGWEVTGVTNLYATTRGRLNALAGYRYFMLNEGLRVEQLTASPGGPAGGPPVLFNAADQFDAHNRFHGGQLGLSADLTRGAVFVEMAGKVALGQGVSVVRVSGQTVALSPGPAVAYSPAGVLGQPSNSGRFVRSGFAVLPEATLKVGYRLADRSRFYVGYNLIYLSEAARPGQQVDLTLDPELVPIAGRGGAGGPGDRPAPLLTRGDFWTQGLTFGLEYRY